MKSRVTAMVLTMAMLAIACGVHNRSTNEVATQNIQLQDLSLSSDSVFVGYVAPAPGRKEAEKMEKEPYNTEDYDNIVENRFVAVAQQPLSTFSIDVDHAAYGNVRRYLQQGQLPPKGAVRIEELINYFDYNYASPTGDDPFAVYTETARCPWNEKHVLVKIGLQGKKAIYEKLPPSNLVFLVDVSGSMNEPNKLPLVQESLKLLTDQLREEDHVAIVTYAGNAGLVLPSTNGSQKLKIRKAIDNLEAGGSTAGGEGIKLAYNIAAENRKPNGNNRVILATDGDFNVGPSSNDELVSLIEKQRESGVFLSVLGYGMGNYKDNKMQQLADKGNGNHNYIDNINEAKKVLVNEFGGTLFTIAKDVKLQLEFNPATVSGYRLIGYENRVMQNEDFNDDKKDAGELGAGHTVTALYEIIPLGVADTLLRKVDDLKYQLGKPTMTGNSELLTIKLRYKQPKSDQSKLLTTVVPNTTGNWHDASDNFRFAAGVAEFGMVLRQSVYKQNSNYIQALELAKGAVGNDQFGYRAGFIELVHQAQAISRETASVEDK